MDAMAESNKLTDGNKWRMFLSQLALGLVIGIVAFIFSKLGVIGSILTFILMVLAMPVFLSLQAYFYKTLVLDVMK